MASESIIIRTEKTFQAKELNDAVKGLQKAFTNIDKNRKDACLIMWRLEDGKKYEKDGFKSLQDFSVTIGIDKSTAHKMADAGRVYDSKNPAIAQFADKAGYTVAANIASMLKDSDAEKALSDAIESDEITEDMTVDAVKAWKANTIKASKPVKVLPKFHVLGASSSNLFEYESIEIEMIPELTGFVKVGAFDMRGSDDKDGNETYQKWTVYASPITGEMVRIYAEKVKKETKKPAVKSAKNMTNEELKAKIAEYQALLAAQAEQK